MRNGTFECGHCHKQVSDQTGGHFDSMESGEGFADNPFNGDAYGDCCYPLALQWDEDERLRRLSVTHRPDVIVDVDGFILLDGRKLTQRQAADTAWELLDAIRKSTDRHQITSGTYYDSQAILARLESPLGQAKSAVSKLYH